MEGIDSPDHANSASGQVRNPYDPPGARVAEAPDSGGSRAAEALGFEDLSRKDQRRFYWGFVWRSLVAALASVVGGMVVGGVVGAIMGGIAGALHVDQMRMLPFYRLVGMILGVVVGLVVTWYFIRALFRAKWFGYRLRLVREGTSC